MEFSDNKEDKYTYLVRFTLEETEVITAAYRERLARKVAKKATVDSLTEAAASWSDSTFGAIQLNDPETVCTELELFHENTVDVILNLPAQTGIPHFASTDIGPRYRLGRAAQDISMLLKQEFAQQENIRRQVNDLSQEIVDTHGVIDATSE